MNGNPWGDYQRHGKQAFAGLRAAFVQVFFVLSIIVGAYYALSCIPFQAVCLAPAHPQLRKNPDDEKLLRRVEKVAPKADLPYRQAVKTESRAL